MWTELGVPFLVWLDDTAMGAAHDQFHRFWNYVRRWRSVLDGEADL